MPPHLRAFSLPPLLCHIRPFSTTRSLHASDFDSQNHYQILQLPYTATPAEIKQQFYALSKAHHPDLHPNEPTAPARFHRLSEAYHILSSSEKRRQYDRQLGRTPSSSSASTPPAKGSYSSHTGPSGSRPASGLSRRRAQFRGPPPSFYAQGGWGSHAGKRSAAAAAGHAANSQGQAAEHEWQKKRDAATTAGSVDTGSEHGWTYWNRAAHLKTHERIDARFELRRARATEQRTRTVEEERKARLIDTMLRAVLLTGLVGAIVALGTAFNSYDGSGTISKRRKIDDGG